MPEKTVDDKKRSKQESSSKSLGSDAGRGSKLLKVFLLVLIAAAGLVVAHRQGLLDPIIQRVASYHALDKLFRSVGTISPAFTKATDDNLFSPASVMRSVGKIPVAPSKDPVSTDGKSGEPESEKSAKACPPELGGGTSPQPTSDTPRAGLAASGMGARSAPDSSPKLLETPVIMPRGPSVRSGAKKEATGSGDASEDGDESGKPIRHGKTPPSSESGAANLQARQKGEGEQAPEKSAPSSPSKDDERRKDRVLAAKEKAAVQEDTTKRERFQLPGSLLVTIHNYEGSLAKWGLMVIMDDSIAMARKTKQWNPNRNEAAASFVKKLPGILTPGSRVAVRDFLCKSSSKRDRGPCLSHLLYDWTAAPFKDLAEQLGKTAPAGRTNPCAAAAYSVKKDFSDQGELTPRILIVTSGIKKCKAADVVRAIDRYKSKEKVVVDVLALGMPRKTARGYLMVCRKSKGVFLRAHNAAAVDRLVAQYKKVLGKRTMEKVEVRGHNAVFTGKPGEEITLAPGSYTVVLPLVERLKESKRTIPNIHIRSGETTVLRVKIRKGRPQVRTAKK